MIAPAARQATAQIADLACRQLAVVERHGQAQITRFCAQRGGQVKPIS
jgi:hypothetical protein